MQGLKNHDKDEKDPQDEQEKSTWTKRIKTLGHRLKLGPHHRMERFTIMLGGSLALLLLFTSISFASYRADVSETASQQTLFTEDFEFSLTGQSGEVVDLYRDDTDTDAILLFDLGELDALSSDAGNYEMFVTGQDGEPSYQPDMSFAMFGTTGYGMIRFQDDTKLESQVFDITIRSNASLTDERNPDQVEIDEEAGEDASYRKHDQARVVVNPGAGNAKELDGFRSGERDPVDLYRMLVAQKEDEKIRQDINQDLDEMQHLLNQSQEYANRIKKAGYEPPEEPWFIKGDYFDDDDVYHTGQDMPLAIGIDYQNTTISDGYIQQVAEYGRNYEDYMDEHDDNAVAKYRNQHDDEDDKQESVDSVDYIVRDDGNELKLNDVQTGESSSDKVNAKDSVESLEGVWRDYLSLKASFQRGDMRDLLRLDEDVQSQSSGYTVYDDDAAEFY